MGSLSSEELWDNGFVRGCKVTWKCTDSTGKVYQESQDCIHNDGYFKIPGRLYNCSVDVAYEHRKGVFRVTSRFCSFSKYTQESNSIETLNDTTDTSLTILSTLSEIASLTQAASSVIITVNKTALPVTASQVIPTLSSSSLLITSRSLVETFTIFPVTTNQATSTGIRNKSFLVDGSTIVAVALSSVTGGIVLVVLVFFTIFIGLFCCKRKEQIHKFNMTERGFHCSLDSIPKAYSYIGKEDQSTCEKPNPKVAGWLNSLDDSEEVMSLNSDDLSNEQMLDALYGTVKAKHISNDNTINVNAMNHINGSLDEIFIVSSTLLSDYMCKFAAHVKSDDPLANSAKLNSTFPVVLVEPVETADHQKAPGNKDLNNGTQNNTLSHGQSLSSVNNTCNNNQKPTKNETRGQDTGPYVSLSKKSKQRPTATDLSDHGEYIEYDDIARKRTTKS